MNLRKDLEELKKTREAQAYGISPIEQLRRDEEKRKAEQRQQRHQEDDLDDFVVDEGRSFKKVTKRIKNPPAQKRGQIGPSIVKSFANMKLSDEDRTKARVKVSAAEDKMNEDLMNDIFNDLDEGARISDEFEKEKAIKEAA